MKNMMPNIPSISSQKIFADIVSVFQNGQITPATFALTRYMNHQRMNDVVIRPLEAITILNGEQFTLFLNCQEDALKKIGLTSIKLQKVCRSSILCC